MKINYYKNYKTKNYFCVIFRNKILSIKAKIKLIYTKY